MSCSSSVREPIRSLSVVVLMTVMSCLAGAHEPLPWLKPLNRAESPYAGSVSGLAVENGHAYVATAGTLAVFDVSEPAAMKFLGFDLTSGSTQDLLVAGEHAFLVGYHAGLEVHDATDPTSFSLPKVGGYALQGSASFSGIGMKGTRLFASGYGAELTLFDISDPTLPRVIGTAPENAGPVESFYAKDIKVADNRIYMAGGDDDWGALMIYADQGENDPAFLGAFRVFDVPFPPTSVSLRVEAIGDTAYLADSGLGLCLLDVSDPAAPALIRKEVAYPLDMKRRGDLLILLLAEELKLFDVSNPRDPVERGSIDLPTAYGKLAIDGTTAYVADYDGGLVAIDISDPDEPELAGQLDITGVRARDVEVVGDLVYVAGQGISVIDASDPASPVLVGAGGNAVHYSLAVAGNLAAAQWEHFGRIHLYDLGEDGQTPVMLGMIQVSNIGGYDLADQKLYVGTRYDGLQLYYIGDPSNPRTRGRWFEEGKPARQVIVKGDLAYVESYDPGLVLLDVSNSSAPRKIGSYPGTGDVNGFAIAGTYAYVAEGQSFSVVDISDPTNPRKLGGVELVGLVPEDVSVSGNFAYVGQLGASDLNVLVIDVKDPAEPFLVRADIGVDNILRFQAEGDLLYLGRGYLGLSILDAELPRVQLSIQMTAAPTDTIQLLWNAPTGTAFEIDGSRDFVNWQQLGRFTTDTLQQAVIQLGQGTHGYFRVAKP